MRRARFVRSREWRLAPWRGQGVSGRRSLWIEQALAQETEAEARVQRLSGSRRADVCIIGGGFTGLWTAIALLDRDPSIEVVVLEADLCGTGASGRNGGVISDYWMELETLAAHLGRDDALRLAAIVAHAADELEQFALTERIDAEVTRGGWYWVATNPAQVANLHRKLESTRGAGVDVYEEVSAGELFSRVGSRRCAAALFDGRGGSLQPAKLARGLRAAAIQRGALVFEHSPVASIDARARILVRTPGGVLSTDRLVLAANAWQAHLPDIRRDTIVVSSDLLATAPAPAAFAALGWSGAEVGFDAKTMLHYWRATREQRLVFGSGGATLAFGARVGSAFEHPSAGYQASLARALGQMLPAFARASVTHAWSGAIDRSSTGLPRVGFLGGDARVMYVTGFSGTGVLPCLVLGRALAATVLGHDDEPADVARLLRRAGRRFPAEPVRYLSGRLVQQAVARTERAHEHGRPPSRAAAAVARLLPAGPVRQ